ncbi:MAG: phosphopyruvate hydratase [Gammaproteobacteria bacterium]|jgi:enolase|nr:phosphopyruvate hydratase [Gammaproteobacteria bacterium]
MGKYYIEHVDAWMIFDSRGVPSICARVISGAFKAKAMVPSGASTGQFEALELRDHASAFKGKGVDIALSHIRGLIRELLLGQPLEPAILDQKMIALDGTADKSYLGANAILAVSIALWRLAAKCNQVSDFDFIQSYCAGRRCLPVPMINIINGGVHATNELNIQEFMIVPHGFSDFKAAISAASEVILRLKSHLQETGQGLLVGDEGGYSLQGSDPAKVMLLLNTLIDQAGFHGKINLALDLAASEYYDPKLGYRPVDQWLGPKEYLDLVHRWVKDFGLISIEDPFADTDEASWEQFMALSPSCLVVGDDLFVTQSDRLQKGIVRKQASAILIKPNQVGTVFETLNCIALAKEHNWPFIISHRSGDTEDTFIADLAVATGAPMIKTGSIARSERVSKYNRLLEIEYEAMDKGGIQYGSES